jgi:hypothetical protein
MTEPVSLGVARLAPNQVLARPIRSGNRDPRRLHRKHLPLTDG